MLQGEKRPRPRAVRSAGAHRAGSHWRFGNAAADQILDEQGLVVREYNVTCGHIDLLGKVMAFYASLGLKKAGIAAFRLIVSCGYN